MIKEIIFAYILDLLFGDPRSFPHPVKAMGKVIEFLEKALRRLPLNLYLSGGILVVILVLGTFILTNKLIFIAFQFNSFLGEAIAIFFIYTTLSIRDLDKETRWAYLALKEDDIVLARERISLIVGRDTEDLTREDAVRACIETVAENTVDGIISPIFFALLGGAPLAMAYKAVNTLDSMVGYKNDKYLKFGWASARMDDLANFIPARLSALIIPMAAAILKRRGMKSFSTMVKDRKKSVSPNAGIPESAFAGALGITLGGRACYQRKKVVIPIMGKESRPKELKDILSAIYLMYLVSGVTLIIGIAIRWYLEGLFNLMV
ncbi:MAG: adenosylcobinamide-phosphate synthase CbiB [Thermodesulfobacteriota bacterium]|nr:adenosylcobinamide-phosphate synthase CbiB [Thermodesulfobacteriota bacterium]